MTSPIIDSHQHFWSIAYDDYGWLGPGLGSLYRDFGPEHLAPHLVESGVDRTILVQAAPSMNETERLLRIAERERAVAGVVGWVPLDDPDVEQMLRRFARHRKFIGVRPMLQDLDDVDWINRDSVQTALRAVAELGLSFDALVKPNHLPGLYRTVDANPRLRVVIDHAAKPDIAMGKFEPWATLMAALAGRRSVYCKLSGLLTEAGGSCRAEVLRPYFGHLVEIFGAGRLMWGSDWPVLEQVGTYRIWYELSREALNGTVESDLDLIFGNTASEFYRLSNQTSRK